MNFRYKFAQFMNGRYIYYGADALSKLLAAVCIVLAVINIFANSFLIYLFETLCIIFMFYRMFSKNIARRQAENQKITQLFKKFKDFIALKKRMRSDKDLHVYKKCPHCNVMLRLPRRPGKHTVNCPRCKNNFEVNVK